VFCCLSSSSIFFRYSRIQGESYLSHDGIGGGGINNAFCTSALGGTEWLALHSGTTVEWVDPGRGAGEKYSVYAGNCNQIVQPVSRHLSH
jgi:hypothetical protein